MPVYPGALISPFHSLTGGAARGLTQKAVKRIVLVMDAFTQQRVVELRQEIASLHQSIQLYQSQKRHLADEARVNEVKRFRLLAIKEELLRMTGPFQRGKR
jgi:hypothetical protein